MADADETKVAKDPAVVFLAERDAIKERREKAWSTVNESRQPYNWKTQEPKGDDLVGLALSGGGIRAASLGLGVLQTFCRTGFIKSVDYLSTVSGGGYIGAHFSSSVISKEVPPERAFEDVATGSPNPGTKQPTLSGLPNGVRKLIYGGKYLVRPWEATNKYLIGLVLSAIVILSGVVALAALIAYLWRQLDRVAVRTILGLFDLNSDVIAAFLPFYVFAGCWFAAWMLSYFRSQAEAPGRWAQRWLYFAVAAFLIGVVLLLVNGKDTKIGFLGPVLSLGGKTELSKWLLGLLGAALLPMLRPQKLMQMGTSTKILDRILFRVATFALLIGVPLAIVGILGTRNISQTASDPKSELRTGDILSWPAFAAVLERPVTDAEKAIQIDKPFEPRADKDSLSPLVAQAYLRTCVQKLAAQRDLSAKRWEQLKERGILTRIYDLLGWRTAQENPVRDTWQAERDFNRTAEEVIQLVNRYVLPSRLLPVTLADNKPLTTIVPFRNDETKQVLSTDVDPSQLDERVAKAVKQHKETFKDDPDIQETLADAALSYTTSWNENNAKGFNQTLLRTLHPECFYLEEKAYRWIVTAGDQKLRLKVLAWAGALFVLGLFVDMNRTSLHRFYRNRLTRAYLVPQSSSRYDVNLSELNTTAQGAPYHLINTTLELTRPRFLDEVDEECKKVDVDRRDRQVFLFSKLYCGATATGWVPTKEYESYLKENVSLGDAMALSGAAADAMLTNSLPVMLLMTTLNLTLGQWMPNPKRGRPWSNARAGVLLLDWFRSSVEKDNYCFVCDGGFSDNLGVLGLLKRRCKVIISVDSTCDPKDQFSDLGVAIRTARIQDGVQIVEPSRLGQTLDTIPLNRDARGNCCRHYLLGRIIYPKTDQLPESRGWLIYIKPSFTCDEGSDLLDYRRQQTEFPHHSTADQFYDATRFESYRQLGVHIAQSFCSELMDQTSASTLDDRLLRLAEKLSDWAPASLQLRSRLHWVAALLNETVLQLADVMQTLSEQQAKAPPYTQFMVGCADRISDAATAIDEQTNNAISALSEATLPTASRKLRADEVRDLRSNSQSICEQLGLIAKTLRKTGSGTSARLKSMSNEVEAIKGSITAIEDDLVGYLVAFAEFAYDERQLPGEKKAKKKTAQAAKRKTK